MAVRRQRRLSAYRALPPFPVHPTLGYVKDPRMSPNAKGVVRVDSRCNTFSKSCCGRLHPRGAEWRRSGAAVAYRPGSVRSSPRGTRAVLGWLGRLGPVAKGGRPPLRLAHSHPSLHPSGGPGAARGPRSAGWPGRLAHKSAAYDGIGRKCG